jgi:hypothetical protein
MKYLKEIGRFLAIFLIAYTLMLSPQTGIDRKYAEFYCAVGNKLFHNFGNGGYVLLKTEKAKKDISVFISKSSLIKGDKLEGQTFHLESSLIGYYYTALIIALILATPLSWKRKIIALSIGFILITAFVMLKLWITIYYYYSISAWLGLYQEESTKVTINFWTNYIARQMTAGYSFVVILWLGVSIGKKEWKKLNGVFSEITANKNSGNKKQHALKQRYR